MAAAHPAGARALDPRPQRVAVFRALQLGDMLCAVPALRALRRALPEARVTLVGLPGAADFVARFPTLIDELLPFPGWPGMPEQPPEPSAWPAFLAAARSRRFDLAIQLHGSGALTNTLLPTLAAARYAGFVPTDAQPPSPDFISWPEHLPEILRYTALVEHLGAPVEDITLSFPLSAQDEAACDELVRQRGLVPARTVLVHPGARLASRRWGAPRFAVVARELARRGLVIAVTGTAQERPLARHILAAVPKAHDLIDATPLGVLAALVSRCRLVVCNDTGMSHVAAAVRTPSVVVASGSDVRRWAPLDAARHPVLWRDMPCRPCAHAVCPMRGHPCASLVEADAVLDTALRQLASWRPA